MLGAARNSGKHGLRPNDLSHNQGKRLELAAQNLGMHDLKEKGYEMNIQEALNVFGLDAESYTEKEIKSTYKKLALKYHPDRNPLGSEMMKAINSAFDVLIKNIEVLHKYQGDKDGRYNYSDELEQVLIILNSLSGIVFEVIGNWVWISGDTFPHKSALRDLKCKWASKKKQWYFRPEEHRSVGNKAERTIEEIREKYGTTGKKKANCSGNYIYSRAA